MYVNEEKSRAVLFSYTLNSRYGENFNRVRLEGLNPDKIYKTGEINVFQKPTFRENGKTFLRGIPDERRINGCTGKAFIQYSTRNYRTEINVIK